jgi:hypothetical protein
MKCGANNWANFIRVADDETEVRPKIVDPEIVPATPLQKLDHLKGMIDAFQNLPENAWTGHVSQYDFWSALVVIYSTLKDILEDSNGTNSIQT